MRKLRAAGRGTYVCEKCQPRPRLRCSSASAAGLVGRDELLVAADRLAVDDDLGERHHPRDPHELGAPSRVLREVDLVVSDAALGEERLRHAAEPARLSRVNRDPAQYFTKYSERDAGSLKTEGIVLRSLRYGEADRILHLYTPHRGRVSAIAKGVRRAKSRFGGRLEPFFRLNLVLYEGRSELLTVTSAETLAGHPRLREDARGARRRRPRLRGRGARVRRRRPASRRLPPARQRARAARRATRRGPRRANALAFRLKLLLAAGFAPQLAACASCGEREHLVGFSGAAGGVVCAACEAGSFPLDQEAHDFLVTALGAAAGRGAGRLAARAGAGRAGDPRDARAPRDTCGCGPWVAG